jgi:hypothetical protein
MVVLNFEGRDKVVIVIPYGRRAYPKGHVSIARGMQSLLFGCYSFLKDLPFQARYIATRHNSLINSIQNARDRRKEIGLENLRVLDQTQGISGEVTNTTANAHR